MAEESEDGKFLVIRVEEGTAAIGDHDPIKVVSALTKVLSQEEIIEHIAGAELNEDLYVSISRDN